MDCFVGIVNVTLGLEDQGCCFLILNKHALWLLSDNVLIYACIIDMNELLYRIHMQVM